jgi:hypothetical protein
MCVSGYIDVILGDDMAIRNLWIKGAVLLAVLFGLVGSAMAQRGDAGEYQILQARYGTFEHNVDVTQRLKELARQDRTFRMGNNSFGIDPHPNQIKTLRIFARSDRGEMRTFEYAEGSLIDGAAFKGWGSDNWGRSDGYNGDWGSAQNSLGDRNNDRNDRHNRNGPRNSRDVGEYQIQHARYGTLERNVDVTQRLKDLARQDNTFRMGNNSFGVDPHPNQIKTLRIFARDKRGETRVFEYREGSLVDGALFKSWGSGRWDHGAIDRGDWGPRFIPENSRNNGATTNQLTIIRAQYGIENRKIDVTGVLRSLVREGRLEMRVENSAMGGSDPAPGIPKMLWVNYSINGGPSQQVRVAERDFLRLQ